MRVERCVPPLAPAVSPRQMPSSREWCRGPRSMVRGENELEILGDEHVDSKPDKGDQGVRPKCRVESRRAEQPKIYQGVDEFLLATNEQSSQYNPEQQGEQRNPARSILNHLLESVDHQQDCHEGKRRT